MSDKFGNSNNKDKAQEKNAQKHIKLIKDSDRVYNNLTYEMIKLLRLMIDFGKYNIIMGSNIKETNEKNKDFFKIIKALIAILEFDKTYPEARGILIEKR